MRFTVWSMLILLLAGLAACDDGASGGALTVDPSTVTASSDAGADLVPQPGGGPANDSVPDASVDAASLDDGSASTPDVVGDAAWTPERSVDSADASDTPADILEPPTDATDVTDARDAAAPLMSCAALAAAGRAERLGTFFWTYQVGPVDPNVNRPYDTVTLTKDCQMTYQMTILPRPKPPAPTTTTRTVKVGAADCAEARGWATNARFLAVLLTGDHCPYGPGNPGDEFEVTLTDGTLDQRKTYLCPEPTLDAVRACTSALVARSFP